MLEVRLFGQFEVQRDGKRIAIPTRNAQALFAYLILNTGKALRREKLAGLLWPDSNEENARSNLRHELWRLRKALETEGTLYLLADDLTIAFNPRGEYFLDVHRLESTPLESSTADDLIQSLGTYLGELLPGFYEEWVFVERNRLQALFEAKVARLLDLLQSEGRWPEVIDWGMRWIAMGQWPEPAYRALMVAYANTGDMSKAMATYEHFAKTLQKEAGIKPSEQTLALYKRLKAGWKPDTLAQPVIPMIQPPISTAGEIASIVITPEPQRSNLPKPLTSFIGREREIQEVERLVSRARLVTIVGPGGVGKTRLAIQVAGALIPQFRDGAWWVELASLFKPTPSPKQDARPEQAELTAIDPVVQAVAKALRVIESPGKPLLEGVLDHLCDKQLLLVLDNCEHLIEACAILAERLLGECPEITILATSRETLEVPGEKVWHLLSLSLPDQERKLNIENLYQSEAASLFIERAGDILPGYQPDEIDAPTIAQLCLRLDGIPLAIELAAARMNLLSVQEIAARLDRRFSLLTDGSRTVLPRHQTLSAAIEWSHDLLNELERVLFRRLTIFADNFTLEAAEVICTGGTIHHDDVLTLIGHLVDKSLLTVIPIPHGAQLATRFRFLDTICSFGRLKLDESGETELMHNRHAKYYVSLAEMGEKELRGSNQLIWLNRLKEDQNNLRAAMQWSLDTYNTEMSLRLAGSLWRYWWMQSQHSEGREWLGKALSMDSPQSPPLRAKALNGAGILARGQSDYYQASVFLNECLEIQRSLQDKNGVANALNSLGILAHLQEEYDRAIAHYQESLNYRREIGDTRGIAALLHNLSMIHQEKGEFVQAEELLKESLALFLRINDARSIAATQLGLGYLMYELGDVERAEDYFQKSMVTLKDLGGRNEIIECLEGFAGIAALLKLPRRGARLLAAAQALRAVIGIPVNRYHQVRYQYIVESVTNQLDAQALECYSAEGRVMSWDEAIDYALSEIE